MKLQDQILKQIEEHLPKMTADKLKERIELVNELEEENEALQKENKKLSKSVDELCDLKIKKENLDDLENELEEKTENLREEQQKFEVEKVKLELKAEYKQEGMDNIYRLVDKIFSNNLIKKSIHGSKPAGVDNSNYPISSAYNSEEEVEG